MTKDHQFSEHDGSDAQSETHTSIFYITCHTLTHLYTAGYDYPAKCHLLISSNHAHACSHTHAAHQWTLTQRMQGL